jgi:hypothetical protein
MKVTLKKIIIPAILGFFIWIAAFFIIGWTQISEDPAIQSLYLPMVALFGLGTFALMIVFLWWYLPYLEIDFDHLWLQESLLCGIIIMLVQFILDIVTFGIFFTRCGFACLFLWIIPR